MTSRIHFSRKLAFKNNNIKLNLILEKSLSKGHKNISKENKNPVTYDNSNTITLKKKSSKLPNEPAKIKRINKEAKNIEKDKEAMSSYFNCTKHPKPLINIKEFEKIVNCLNDNAIIFKEIISNSTTANLFSVLNIENMTEEEDCNNMINKNTTETQYIQIDTDESNSDYILENNDHVNYNKYLANEVDLC
ncbi:hypothetical protein C1646_754969 [Rhizophagus diaphanus]|nr:hypothetical protein C1646_754969 [Rhizophagus diaphanus] [Rhizophagus sp. MUCL 43196]